MSDNVTIRNAVNDLTGRHAGYVLILSGGPAAEGGQEAASGPTGDSKCNPQAIPGPAGDGSSRSAAYRFILGSIKKDCKAALSFLQQALSIKGGGTPEMVQGTISASKEAIETAFSQLL